MQPNTNRRKWIQIIVFECMGLCTPLLVNHKKCFYDIQTKFMMHVVRGVMCVKDKNHLKPHIKLQGKINLTCLCVLFIV